MLVDKRDDIKTQGNLDGQKVAMKFDENSLAHIMSVLTDLYSDPELAVIREYSTNALDSHKEAGVSRPIEVTLPSPLSPFFKIKDFGIGLSVDEVVNVYSKYGASTKRDSNEFNGMLGLGGKSALTYTSQFNVVAVKGGVKIHVSVSRSEDGTGTMEIVDTVATSEPNGVEIVVPVRYGSQFEAKARRFYSFWTPGTVLVNGEAPAHVGGNEVAPGIFSVSGLDEDYIVMGGVSYPVEKSLYSQGYYKNFGVVAFVPIGSVNFTPSREALHYTPKTEREVERIRNEFKAGLVASIENDIAASADHAEAIAKHHNWSKMLGYSLPKGLKYKGAEIPAQWSVYGMTYEPNCYRRQKASNTRQAYYEWLQDATIITGFSGDSLSQTHKAKIQQYADENDLGDKFLLVEKPFAAQWLAGIDTVDFADIKAVKLPSGPRKQGVKTGKQSYMRWDTATDWWVKDDTLSKTSPIFYFSPSEKYDNDHAKALTALRPDAMIVMLGMNRWDKFKREFPQAQHVLTLVDALIPTAAVNVTTNDLKVLAFENSYGASNTLRKFDASKVDDPDLVEAIGFAKGASKSAGYDHYQKVCRMASLFRKGVKSLSLPKWENPLEKYPLVGTQVYGSVTAHHYIYINAAFAAGN